MAAAARSPAITAFPYRPGDRLLVAGLAGKVVLDTDDYTVWRDGHHPRIESGQETVHELRQERVPTSGVAEAFTQS